MDRRDCLQGLAAAFTGAAIPLPTAAARPVASEAPPARTRLAAAWRGPRESDPHRVGVLVVDWEARSVRIAWSAPLPTRPHGLCAEPDGGLLVTGVRPGTWLARYDASGHLVTRVSVEDEAGDTRLNGHVTLAPDGQWLYSTETDLASGRGRIAVRDGRTLRTIDRWDSLGIEPHQLVCDAHGDLLVANGGIPRTLSDRKHSLDRMDANLVRLQRRDGRPSGHWRLADPRLSLRHLAWSGGESSTEPRLGIALQAEHDDEGQRLRAPTLAIFEAERLALPATDAAAGGYAGDICAAASDGFVITNNRLGGAWWWTPTQPQRLTRIASLREAYALADAPHGALIASAYGIARWHPSAAPAMAAWPEPMALDNHWVRIDAA